MLSVLSAKAESRLPFDVVFKGRAKFDRLVALAEAGNWRVLPIGERTATVGRALVGTPYKSFTLEIDDRIEAPSVNFDGMDCWTFFEAALAFARMLNEPRETWTPETLLNYIELDRYRNGVCTGAYLSRLHYLEDWDRDNERRGLVSDITRSLGGNRLYGDAREMTIGWRHYRYLAANTSLLPELARMESRVTRIPIYHVPKRRVASIESKLQDGDIISITSHEPGGRTSHVGLAIRDSNGTVRFMHASSPNNYGRVVIDRRLSDYLFEFGSHAGIIVTRPLK
ncbi:MAG: DUF1460 domain-containing protein [Verrucomicrobiota bacterium]|nr:DUF1460 domain-containing protein [Verrucomicrobiota bacterium]